MQRSVPFGIGLLVIGVAGLVTGLVVHSWLGCGGFAVTLVAGLMLFSNRYAIFFAPLLLSASSLFLMLQGTVFHLGPFSQLIVVAGWIGLGLSLLAALLLLVRIKKQHTSCEMPGDSQTNN